MKTLMRRAPRGPLLPTRPATAVSALAAAAVLATSACGQATTPAGPATAVGGGGTTAAGSPVQTGTAGAVRLEASMAPGSAGTGSGIAASSGLVVEYTLTNTGTTPLLAYDVVPRDLGSATLAEDVDPEHTWVYEKDGVLRLSKQGFAPAPNVRFAAAPVMGGHTIAPGAVVKGRAYAASPPRLVVPGDSFEAPREPVDPSVKQWQLCVQVADRAAQARPSAVGGGVVESASMAPEGDDLVCTEPAAIPVA